MKRSEMITKLRNYLFGEDERPELFSRFSNEAFTDCADAILTFLESHGMQPPGTLYDSKLLGQIRYHGWEHEDSKND